MNDREKVIKGLELCQVKPPDTRRCEECPYQGVDIRCIDELHRNAFSLLKEQEPIPCGKKIKAGDIVLDFYECGYCKNAIRKPWKYCPFCGKEVKWDGSNRKTLVRK